jgi:hypothetical protein
MVLHGLLSICRDNSGKVIPIMRNAVLQCKYIESEINLQKRRELGGSNFEGL